MAEEKDFEKILSVQPFWGAEKKNKYIITDPELNGPVAVVYEVVADPGVKGLKSIPGIGLIGINFSLEKEKPQAMVCGVLNKSKEVPLYGVSRILSCQFYPGQFTRLFGIPSNEITDIEVPLDDFILPGSLAEEIASADSFQGSVERFQQFINTWKKRNIRITSNNSLVQYLVANALRTHGTLQIADLEKETGYSARYIQKVMLEHVGLAPKVALNNIRFQNVVRQLIENPYASLAETAQAAGYYDQSHFTKIFKEYMGITPHAFVKILQEMLKAGTTIRK